MYGYLRATKLRAENLWAAIGEQSLNLQKFLKVFPFLQYVRMEGPTEIPNFDEIV